eukprot:scaffold42827_cov496-Skeletonema_marinoi.AAC.1
MLKLITHCKAVDDGIRSDHSAIRITWTRAYSSEGSKTHTSITNVRGTLNKEELLEDNNIEYNELVAKKLEECPDLKDDYDSFMEMLVKIANEASTSAPYKKIPWYEFDRDILMPLIEERNELMHRTRHEDLSVEELELVKIEISDMNKYIHDKCLAAKSKWARYMATR